MANTLPAGDENEELLTEVRNRFVMFPIKYNTVWNMYKKAESAFWTAEELDLTKDMNDWEKLNENERHFIKHVLAFFAASDGIVNENLAMRFYNDVKAPEVKAFYSFQLAMESVHCVTGDTEVLTDKGYLSIEYLAKCTPECNVWNGHAFSPVHVVQTSASAPIFRVMLSNGMFLDCTSQHKWLIQGQPERVFTENLKPGMTLEEFTYPTFKDLIDPEIFTHPYEHGVACMQPNDHPYDMPFFNMRPKSFVPVNYSMDTKAKWLTGVLTHAHIDMNNPMEILQLTSTNASLILHLQRLLTTLNVHSTTLQPSPQTKCLTLNVLQLKELLQWGVTLNDSELYNNIMSLQSSASPSTISVVDVTPVKDAPTFCFNEPERHVGFFNGIATGQSETYSLLIDTYIKNPQERNHLFNAISTIPCIQKKADWALKWIEDKDSTFAKRLLAFACVEGIFFSGAFCAIFWLKERGVMPGLCLSNEFISRDEGLHTEFAALLYTMIRNKLTQEEVYGMFREAVEIEDEFINVSIPCNMLGMNGTLMSQYIKFVADRLLVQLGYDKLWNVTNPFDFMDRIGLENKSNFFEHTRISEYAKANVGKTGDDMHKFSLEEDF